MAEVLVRAIDNHHADPVKDRRGCYKRGYPVVVMPAGHSWGSKEGAPGFVVLDVSDASREELEQYLASWDRQVTFAVVAHDPPTDGYRLDVSVDPSTVDASGTAGITQQQVETFLEQWNYTQIVETAANRVRFDILVWDALRSKRMWRVQDLNGIQLAKSSYDQGTGEYEVGLDWSATGWPAQKVEYRITSRGGAVNGLDLPSKTGTFQIHRSDVRQAFMDDVAKVVGGRWCRKRWYMPNTIMNQAESNGGTLTMTKADFQAVLIDKLTE